MWTIFNHIYDVHTGISIEQKVFCGGGGCCCPDCGVSACPDHTECCDIGESGYQSMDYSPGRVYVVGNLFHHILPFEEDPATSFGQAVRVGYQSQVRVVNNTLYKCAQGVQVSCVYDPYDPGDPPPNPGDCPPYADENNKSRNTSVAVMNNVVLDTPDDSSNDSHIRVCTNRSQNHPDYPFTLTEGQFDRNVHFGSYRAFYIGGLTYSSIEEVQGAQGNYADNSKGDLPSDNPNLDDPALLSFHLRTTAPISPTFMYTGGVKDAAYTEFELAFPAFPNIYRDYAGQAYSGTTCAIGAFGD